MKVEFRFNATNQIILVPENSKEIRLLQMFFEDKPDLRFGASAGEAIIIESCQAVPHEWPLEKELLGTEDRR